MKYGIFTIAPDGDYYGMMPVSVVISFFIMFYSLPIELLDRIGLNYIKLAGETVT